MVVLHATWMGSVCLLAYVPVLLCSYCVYDAIMLFLIIVPALVPVIIGLAARYREYGVENDSGELE